MVYKSMVHQHVHCPAGLPSGRDQRIFIYASTNMISVIYVRFLTLDCLIWPITTRSIFMCGYLHWAYIRRCSFYRVIYANSNVNIFLCNKIATIAVVAYAIMLLIVIYILYSPLFQWSNRHIWYTPSSYIWRIRLFHGNEMVCRSKYLKSWTCDDCDGPALCFALSILISPVSWRRCSQALNYEEVTARQNTREIGNICMQYFSPGNAKWKTMSHVGRNQLAARIRLSPRMPCSRGLEVYLWELSGPIYSIDCLYVMLESPWNTERPIDYYA